MIEKTRWTMIGDSPSDGSSSISRRGLAIIARPMAMPWLPENARMGPPQPPSSGYSSLAPRVRAPTQIRGTRGVSRGCAVCGGPAARTVCSEPCRVAGDRRRRDRAKAARDLAHWRSMLDRGRDEPYRGQIVAQLDYLQRRADFIEPQPAQRWLAGRIWSWPAAPL